MFTSYNSRKKIQFDVVFRHQHEQQTSILREQLGETTERKIATNNEINKNNKNNRNIKTTTIADNRWKQPAKAEKKINKC